MKVPAFPAATSAAGPLHGIEGATDKFSVSVEITFGAAVRSDAGDLDIFPARQRGPA